MATHKWSETAMEMTVEQWTRAIKSKLFLFFYCKWEEKSKIPKEFDDCKTNFKYSISNIKCTNWIFFMILIIFSAEENKKVDFCNKMRSIHSTDTYQN